jgi:hypothetical protein
MEVKKLTEEELKKLQDTVNEMNKLLHAIEGAKKKLSETQKELENIYGNCSVDISTGEIKENEPNTEN